MLLLCFFAADDDGQPIRLRFICHDGPPDTRYDAARRYAARA